MAFRAEVCAVLVRAAGCFSADDRSGSDRERVVVSKVEYAGLFVRCRSGRARWEADLRIHQEAL